MACTPYTLRWFLVFCIYPWPALPIHCADSYSVLYLSVACTRREVIPGSWAECPASGTMKNSASGHLWNTKRERSSQHFTTKLYYNSTPYLSFQQHIVVVVVHFYIALFSTLEQTRCACMWFLHKWLTFYSAFFYLHRSGALMVLAWLVPHETAAVSAHSVYTTQPGTMSFQAKPHM